MATKKSQRKRANPVKKRNVLEQKGMKIGIVIIVIAVIAASSVYLLSGISEEGKESDINGNNENGSNGNEVDGNGNESNGNGVVENPIAIIDTSMGTIKVELYQDKVPKTCENFIKLANDGFYDNLVFHRIIDDFMIQGGGFKADGTHKESPYGSIDLEINPEVRHVDGAIAMARTSDPNSATSQFFINDGNQYQLERGGVDPYGYAAFGIVIDGIDVVRKIASVDTTTKYGMQNWPITDVIINSITIEG